MMKQGDRYEESELKYVLELEGGVACSSNECDSDKCMYLWTDGTAPQKRRGLVIATTIRSPRLLVWCCLPCGM